jgi:hypothetical protein
MDKFSPHNSSQSELARELELAEAVEAQQA